MSDDLPSSLLCAEGQLGDELERLVAEHDGLACFEVEQVATAAEQDEPLVQVVRAFSAVMDMPIEPNIELGDTELTISFGLYVRALITASAVRDAHNNARFDVSVSRPREGYDDYPTEHAEDSLRRAVPLGRIVQTTYVLAAGEVGDLGLIPNSVWDQITSTR